MKPSYATIEAFLEQKRIAVFGVSRGGKKLGNAIFRHLHDNGHAVFAVHPEAVEVEGQPAYREPSSIPGGVDAAILSIRPDRAEQTVKDCITCGIRHIWLQPGSESETTVRYCRDHGVEPVVGECFLMFAEPVRSIHKLHRTIRTWLGRMPVADKA